MALTILTAPANTSSVSNEMIFVIEESVKANNPATYPNYKFILDIYVDSTLIARVRKDPDPTYHFGIFDVSKELQNYAPDYLFLATYSNLTETYDVKTTYQVKLGEEYGDTLYTNLVTDSERTCYRAYSKKNSQHNTNIASVYGVAASNMPRALKGYKEDKWFLFPFVNNVSGQTITYGFDDGSTLIGSQGTVSYTGAMINKILQINMGFEKLATVLGLTASQQDQVKRLTFDNGQGEVWTVIYQCTKHPTLTLAWLNQYGAYESYTFGLVSKKSTEVSRKEFAQKNFKVNASGEVSRAENGVYYGAKRGFHTTSMVNMKLTSHLLTKEEYTWLADLFSSPDVYMYDPDNAYFFPVTVKDNNYEYRTYLNSKLTPLEFSVEFSEAYNSQLL